MAYITRGFSAFSCQACFIFNFTLIIILLLFSSRPPALTPPLTDLPTFPLICCEYKVPSFVRILSFDIHILSVSLTPLARSVCPTIRLTQNLRLVQSSPLLPLPCETCLCNQSPLQFSNTIAHYTRRPKTSPSLRMDMICVAIIESLALTMTRPGAPEPCLVPRRVSRV